jgi:[acyl-carrier-protein] S-malonyltransferase
MPKVAFVFPGQGAQYVGMGKDLYNALPEISATFDKADNILGIRLKDIMFEGPADKLCETEITQPAIVTMSIAIYRYIERRGFRPDITAGLSLGEYSALVAAEALGFEDALTIVRKRGRFMQDAVALGVGAMAAVLGLERQQVIECCRAASADGIVEAANFNCPGQVVISGEIKAVEKAIQIAKEKGAKRALLLPVSAPFHCSMLEPALLRLAEELKHINIKNARIPVVANVNAREEIWSEDIAANLVAQVSKPVLWEDTVRNMIAAGVTTFIEIGPGKALTGFIKKIDKTVKTYNIEDLVSLENTMVQLEGLKCCG